MISLDTSAIIAIALEEPEHETFAELITSRQALVGTPTLLEARLVLTSRISDQADTFIERFIRRPSVHPVAFSLRMHYLAAEAFDRFGKGRHPAKLNICDCMAYAVARFHDAPLLYKGGDFALTDIPAALP